MALEAIRSRAPGEGDPSRFTLSTAAEKLSFWNSFMPPLSQPERDAALTALFASETPRVVIVSDARAGAAGWYWNDGHATRIDDLAGPFASRGAAETFLLVRNGLVAPGELCATLREHDARTLTGVCLTGTTRAGSCEATEHMTVYKVRANQFLTCEATRGVIKEPGGVSCPLSVPLRLDVVGGASTFIGAYDTAREFRLAFVSNRSRLTSSASCTAPRLRPAF